MFLESVQSPNSCEVWTSFFLFDAVKMVLIEFKILNIFDNILYGNTGPKSIKDDHCFVRVITVVATWLLCTAFFFSIDIMVHLARSVPVSASVRKLPNSLQLFRSSHKAIPLIVSLNEPPVEASFFWGDMRRSSDILMMVASCGGRDSNSNLAVIFASQGETRWDHRVRCGSFLRPTMLKVTKARWESRGSQWQEEWTHMPECGLIAWEERVVSQRWRAEELCVTFCVIEEGRNRNFLYAFCLCEAR